MAEALGECCPNFGTLALFKKGERRPNVDIYFMAWALPGTHKSSQNHSKIQQQSIKNRKQLLLGVALGTPGLPLEASWAPLGGRMPKTIKKVTWWTPPGGAKGGHF